MTAIERLGEIRKADWVQKGLSTILVDANKEKALDALEAILAMEERDMNPAFSYSSYSAHGYNQCLADVRALIEGKVG